MAMGSGSDTEEGRAFQQSRLALFGRWIFVISGSFLVVFAALRAVTGIPFDTAVLYHVFGTALAGVIWALGTSTRMTVPAMHWVDAVGTVLICVCLALMGWGYGRTMTAYGMDPFPVLYIELLATGYVLMARAIALPSTAARTVWIGIASMLPLLAVDVVVLSAARLLPPLRTMAFMEMVTWKTASVTMSAIASRVIFGLRAAASESRRVGRYTLEEKIGEGGMGVVYRARHAMLRRPTAVKLLPPEKAGSEDILRFEREVQLTAGLSHPNTVAIFDYGRTVDGGFYYAMEYLDGITLDELVALDGAQLPGRVVQILLQVSGALAEAHGVGLVHRDVKPANIILCERGGVPDVAKVVDFGLVKRFRADSSDATAAVTAATTLVGTPLYMAPEAITGESGVDARSDLYALGAVAYLLLTGTPVFSAPSVVSVFGHHLHTIPEPPSTRLGRPVPAELERLVLQCLAKTPGERPDSARALSRDLQLVACTDWSDDDAAAWWARYRRTGSRRGGAVDGETSIARV